jgi:ABC-type lipoprotein release transport system permease subunit
VLPTGVARFDDLLNLSEEATPEEFETLFRWIDLRVVGIGRVSDQLLSNENQEQGFVAFSPAFAREFHDYATFRVLAVELQDPEDLRRFETALRAEYDDVPLQLTPRVTKEATFGRIVQPYVDALQLFALAAAVTGLLVTAQALVRLVAVDGTDGGTLDALGATRPQRALVSAARAAITVAVGAVFAVVLAIALSPLFPFGPAREAELDAGVRIDPVVLGVGAVAMVSVLSLVVGWTAWRRARFSGLGTRLDEPARRPSALSDRLGRLGAPVSAVTGVRFALERDRTHGAGPLATTLFGLVIAITTIGAALTFGTNLDRLVTTPQRYGWEWDTLIDPGDEGADKQLIAEVREDESLSDVTIGSRAVVPIGGHVLPAYGLRQLRGHANRHLTALEGRLPTKLDEVALGGQSLADLDRHVGDTVVVRAADGTPTRLRIVGRTAFPSLSLNATYGLGEGAAFTANGLKAIEPDVGPSFFLVDLSDGTSLRSVRHHYGDQLGVEGVRRPGDIVSYSRIRATPVVLAGLLAILGIGVLAHLLVTSIHSRRRDLAVMKTLGCTRRQLGLTVAWQATALVSVSLLVGIPLGVIGGQVVWRAFAESLGIGTAVVVPVLAFVGIAVAGLLVANFIALVPARAAARTRAATVLAVHDS